MELPGFYSQDEQVTLNSSELIRRSPLFASIWDTINLCPPPRPGLFESSESSDATSSFPLSDDSGYGTSSFDPDEGFSPILHHSEAFDVNAQFDEVKYSNSSEPPCHSLRNALLPDEGELLLLNNSLKGNFHKLTTACNSTMVAEVPFSQTLQPLTRWHEPLTFHQDRDTRPEIAVTPYYSNLGTSTEKCEPSRHSPPQDPKESKAVTTALVAEAQIITMPDATDTSGRSDTCSSSPITIDLLSPTVHAPGRDELSEGNLKSLNEKRDVVEWVISTKDASPALPALPSIPSPRSTSCSLKTIRRSCATGESLSGIRNLDDTRDLIRELLQTLSHHDDESGLDEASSLEDTPVGSTYSSSPPTDGSGTDTSPKSGTSTNTSSFEIGSKRSHPTRDGSSQEGDGEEPTRKQSRQEKNPSNPEATMSFQGRTQMPCPVQQPQRCQGTNATISELLRSLEVRHRIVICKDCCTQVNVPEEERRPENARKRHKLETCEARCIGTTCTGTASDGAPYHRRTENCPTWQSLPSEIRWSFIWGLINPGVNPPDPDFYNGVGYEHNATRRPCKQQPRARGADICDALMRDIEERDKRRVSLEAKLETANEKVSQMEEKQKRKIGSLENIIEALLERLEENNVKVPNSLQKRLQDECPGVFCEPVAQLISKRTQAPPTPSSMFKDGTGELGQSQLNQPTIALLQPPLFSIAGPGDGYSQPFDFDLSGELFTNFNYTDGVLVDSSQQLPGGMA